MLRTLTFCACFLTFAQRFFIAFTIAALPAADKTRRYRVSVKIGEVDAKDSALTGQFTVQVQDNTGAPISDGTTVTLLTSNGASRLSIVVDVHGQAHFSSLPTGQYAIEVTASGYRTFQPTPPGLCCSPGSSQMSEKCGMLGQ